MKGEKMKKENQSPTLILLTDWYDTFGIFTTRRLRQLVFENKSNFNEVVVRIDGRIYICKESLFEWIKKLNPSWNYPSEMTKN